MLLDLGGFVVTEDTTGDIYTTKDERDLTFARGNLETICDDLLPKIAGPVTATLDGKPITTGTAISTAPVVARVGPRSGHFYTDSVALGHPAGWPGATAAGRPS